MPTNYSQFSYANIYVYSALHNSKNNNVLSVNTKILLLYKLKMLSQDVRATCSKPGIAIADSYIYYYY